MVQYYILSMDLSRLHHYSERKGGKNKIEKEKENPKLGLGLSFCMRKKGEVDQKRVEPEGSDIESKVEIVGMICFVRKIEIKYYRFYFNFSLF